MSATENPRSGSCALCLESAELRNSHIISEFLYSTIYDEKHRFHVLEAGGKYPYYEQKGYREPLLCQECETKLSKWETYARAILTGGKPLKYWREDSITWIRGIDYQRFKLFQLSILWRAGVATGVSLAKYCWGRTKSGSAECCWRMILASHGSTVA